MKTLVEINHKGRNEYAISFQGEGIFLIASN